jgi:uncharacterized membrane protein
VNLAHLHLLLNHIPTVGFLFGLALFVVSLLRKSDDLRQASLVAFYAIALVSIPVYLSGSAAEFAIRELPEVSQDVIAAHRDAAMLALIFMQLTGLVAWLALWRFRPVHLPVVLVLASVTFSLMARAATLGGEVRHPEILAEGAPAAVPAWPRAAAAGQSLIVDHPWVWPICEIFHFVGLTLLFGVVLLVNLRLLGFVRNVAFADLRRLLPWAVVGLGINIVTGMLFVLASPDQYTQNRAFVWKMGVMVGGGLTLLYQTMFDPEAQLKPQADAPLTAKIVALASTSLWAAVIFLGRFLPYIGSE